ncbi:hypothetical protein QUF72_01935 [Desulfobacterales bacterium HSG2]|nr:hypothetical protein [Desulfobacterales bacterium HSG2]
MAILKSELLSLEISFTRFDEAGWVHYEICFRWKNELIINDKILKRDGEYWGARKTGSFLANEYERDGLTRVISQVLNSNEPEYWEPMEPDMIVAIYPEMYFPFMKSHHKLVYERDEHRKEREEREKRKKESGRLPDDIFTIIVFIDAYNFKDSNAYYGEGISLHLIADRETLEKFNSELSKEYAEFKEKYKLDEYQVFSQAGRDLQS